MKEKELPEEVAREVAEFEEFIADVKEFEAKGRKIPAGARTIIVLKAIELSKKVKGGET